jgi:L-ascorbate metabolism protein UlaG (beta-lactamase superfamily)
LRSVELRYLGWAGFELRAADRVPSIVIDPFCSGDAGIEIPASPVVASELTDVGLVLVTHIGHDHLGDSADVLQKNPDALLCGGTELVKWAAAAHLPESRTIMVVPGTRTTFPELGVSVRAVRASHHSVVKIGADSISGEALCYFLEFDSGVTIFHSGDTALTADLSVYGRRYRPDVGLLGVGGATVHGRLVHELDPLEALEAAAMLGLRGVIPMHFNGSEAVELSALVARLSGLKMWCKVLEPGQRARIIHYPVEVLIDQPLAGHRKYRRAQRPGQTTGLGRSASASPRRPAAPRQCLPTRKAGRCSARHPLPSAMVVLAPTW